MVPDGRRLAFLRTQVAPSLSSQLIVAEADGGQERRLPSAALPRTCSGGRICTAYADIMGEPMNTERHVRLFRNGRNQALRIPRDLELPGRAATLRKEGTRLIVEPVAGLSLLAVLAKLKALDERLPPVARHSAEPVDL